MTKKKNDFNIPLNYTGYSVEEKNKMWSDWSKSIKNGGTGFPYDMEDIAQKINLEKSLDIDEHYGYKILYFMFFEEESKLNIEEYFKTDDGYRIWVT